MYILFFTDYFWRVLSLIASKTIRGKSNFSELGFNSTLSCFSSLSPCRVRVRSESGNLPPSCFCSGIVVLHHHSFTFDHRAGPDEYHESRGDRQGISTALKSRTLVVFRTSRRDRRRCLLSISSHTDLSSAPTAAIITNNTFIWYAAYFTFPSVTAVGLKFNMDSTNRILLRCHKSLLQRSLRAMRNRELQFQEMRLRSMNRFSRKSLVVLVMIVGVILVLFF